MNNNEYNVVSYMFYLSIQSKNKNKLKLACTHAIFPGQNNNKGTTGESEFPYMMKPISCNRRRKYRQFQANWLILRLPKNKQCQLSHLPAVNLTLL